MECSVNIEVFVSFIVKRLSSGRKQFEIVPSPKRKLLLSGLFNFAECAGIDAGT